MTTKGSVVLGAASKGMGPDVAGHAMAGSKNLGAVEIATAPYLGATTKALVALANRIAAADISTGDTMILAGMAINAQVNRKRCGRCKGRQFVISRRTGIPGHCRNCGGKGFFIITHAEAMSVYNKTTSSPVDFAEWKARILPVWRSATKEVRTLEAEGMIHIEERLS